MNSLIMNSTAITLAGLVGLSFAAGLDAQANKQVNVGDSPSYTFRQPLLNGRGVNSLADLNGRPTIIEFWGVR